jgi:cyclase
MAALALPCAASAHAGPRLAQSAPTPQKIHRVEKVADDVYAILTDRGGNIGLVVGERFAVLIDDQFEELVPGLLEAVRSVTDKPLKYVVNTHHHGDHTGGNLVLEKRVQAIVAHANVRKRMRQQQEKLEPSKRGGLPELALGDEDPAVKARLDVHLGNVELHLVHFAAGHTDNDVLVGIPQRLVLHAGDVFFNGLTPYIDVDAGGSVAGTLATVEWLLSWLPDGARIIPGHGPVGGKKELARYRDFLRAVEKHVQANGGKTGKELAASFDRAAFPDVKDLQPFLSWEQFFDLAAGRPRGR